jgi:hypothetical protein
MATTCSRTLPGAMKVGKPYNQPTLRAEETGDPQSGASSPLLVVCPDRHLDRIVLIYKPKMGRSS